MSKISVTGLGICSCPGTFDMQSNLKTREEEGLFEGLILNTRKVLVVRHTSIL